MPLLRIENLHKSYKHGVMPVLNGVDFELEPGEICAVVGESGSGKSTLLKVIAGLEPASEGAIILDGKKVSSKKEFVPPEKRKIGFVFQDFALFPHLTIEKNVGFGLPRAKNKRERVRELLTLVGLEKHGNKYPNELSGGEQQRVALARALAPSPQLLLLDEPFSNLDVGIKKEIRAFLFNIIRTTGVSCIFVTHDLDDAMAYADNICILHKGKIEQKGTPASLYENPSSAYVAGFFGGINVLCRKTAERLNISIPEGQTCAVRSCHFQCQNTAGMPVNVVENVNMGNHQRLAVETEDGSKLELELPIISVPSTDQIAISVNPEDVLFFEDKDSNQDPC